MLALLLAFSTLLMSGCAGTAPPHDPEVRALWAAAPLKAPAAGLAQGSVEHVILVSVDGLRPDAVTRHTPDELPNFYRLRTQGASTHNARTDADYSITLPNHMAQLTGRPVTGADGHNWIGNSDPDEGQTLHANKGAYVASVFDVVSDSGLGTAVYASKSKFVLLEQSYDASNGAPDATGSDDGRDKIDTFVYESDTEDLVARFVGDLEADAPAFSFVHLRDPDSAGHVWKWSLRKGSRYMQSIRKVDGLLGQILDAVENDPDLAGNTVVIVTADHGGSRRHHDAGAREHYTIPFYVWGAGVPPTDLYALNEDTRQDPGEARPGFGSDAQPIRNGDAANLALSLLGLGDVPGSTINTAAKLRVWPGLMHLADDQPQDSVHVAGVAETK